MISTFYFKHLFSKNSVLLMRELCLLILRSTQDSCKSKVRNFFQKEEMETLIRVTINILFSLTHTQNEHMVPRFLWAGPNKNKQKRNQWNKHINISHLHITWNLNHSWFESIFHLISQIHLIEKTFPGSFSTIKKDIKHVAHWLTRKRENLLDKKH